MDRKNCMVQCKMVLCHLKVNESLNGLILNPPMNHTADTFGMARRHAQKKDEPTKHRRNEEICTYRIIFFL